MTTEARLPHEEMQALIERGDAEAVCEQLDDLAVEDIRYTIHRLGPAEKVRLLHLLSEAHSDTAATLMEHFGDSQAANLVEDLPAASAASILRELDSDDRADILRAVEPDHAQRIIQRLDPEDAADARRLVAYPSNSAGGLMITEYLAHRATESIQSVLFDLQRHAEEYARYDVQYVYVTGERGELLGVIRLRDLVLTPGDRPLSQILIPNPRHVRVTDEQTQLQAFFDEHGFFAAPVVDERGVLVGVVRRAAVVEAQAEQAGRALLAFGGIIGGEELRSMPTRTRILRRLMFLCPNILLNLLAASVVAMYEPTIAAVTALAIFLPMLSDMSGCAGNQAVAVSIRELSLGWIKPRDLWHTLNKEVGVGVINGLVLGFLIGAIAWLMRGEDWPLIGVVVGGAMCLNSVVAVVIGGTVPLLLRRGGVDPALAASPILTTFTDLCGFFLTLQLATAVLL
ncbi:MAG: magnesium transporter [Polyangiaceae bacterium]|nr:magnesium transporter [Polyangiaceae bacterium]